MFSRPQKIIRKLYSNLKSANAFSDWKYDESQDKLRHAEEFLCDVAVQLRKETPQKKYRFTIYGKKRPCLTCVIRMKTVKIDKYNDKHGRLFLHGVKWMPADESFEALKLLMDGPTHVMSPDITDYDTESESESEDELPDINSLFLF